jgi:hypothetical protein
MMSVELGITTERWEAMPSNMGSWLTSHYQRPQQWMPSTLYRFYQPEGGRQEDAKDDVFLFQGVLLDRQDASPEFKEPWVTFGLYQFFPGFERPGFERNGNLSEWVETPLVEGDQKPDGKFYPWENSSGDPHENHNLRYQAVAAIPLVEIDSETSLHERIVKPLLGTAKERMGQIG